MLVGVVLDDACDLRSSPSPGEPVCAGLEYIDELAANLIGVSGGLTATIFTVGGVADVAAD